MTPAGALSKAYSNSLLVLLNNRGALRQQRDTITVGNSVSLPPLQLTRPIQVNVNQEMYTQGDRTTADFVSSDKVRTPSLVLSMTGSTSCTGICGLSKGWGQRVGRLRLRPGPDGVLRALESCTSY